MHKITKKIKKVQKKTAIEKILCNRCEKYVKYMEIHHKKHSLSKVSMI